MLALFVVILMISTQNQADGISRPTQRSKKMLYGKSRLTFQPFLCKSENADASLGGRTETNPSSPITKIDVTSTDSLNSVEDRIKTVRDFMNPIQILEAMNMQRNLQPSTSTDSKILKISEDKKPVSSVTPERSLMVPAQQQQQRSWQKAKTSTGSANIYWRSVDVDDLRSHPFFSRSVSFQLNLVLHYASICCLSDPMAYLSFPKICSLHLLILCIIAIILAYHLQKMFLHRIQRNILYFAKTAGSGVRFMRED